MVRIRLRRVGAKKQPSYRVVVADQRSPRDGRFIETIGHYDPRTDPPSVVIHEDRALYWISVGAVPSGPVQRFFDKLDLSAKLKKVRGGAAIEEVAAPRHVPEPPVKEQPAAPSRASSAKAKPAAAAAEPEVETAASVEPEAEVVAEVAAETVTEAAEADETFAEAAEATVAQAADAVEAATEAGAEAVADTLEAASEAMGDAADAARSLVDAGLPTRIANSLEAAGVNSLDALRELADKGDDALLEIQGVGAKAVEEIRAFLDDQR